MRIRCLTVATLALSAAMLASQPVTPASASVVFYRPAAITVSTTDPIADYRETVTVEGTLTDVLGQVPVRDATMTVLASTNGRDFFAVASRRTDSNGVVAYTFQPTKKVFFRFSSEATGSLSACTSGVLTQECRAVVTGPKANPRVYPDGYFNVAGYLKPHHPEGTKPIKLLFDHWEGGRWVLRRTAEPAVSDVDGETQYHCLMSPLTLLGSWRVRAVHEDWGHARTETKPALIVVEEPAVMTKAIVWMSDHYPSQNTTVTAYARAYDQYGKPIPYVVATFTWHFETWTRTQTRYPWKADGVVADPYRLGAVKPGYRVVVEVTLRDGVRMMKATNWFVPRVPPPAVGPPTPKPVLPDSGPYVRP